MPQETCRECAGYGSIPIPGCDENQPPKCSICRGVGRTWVATISERRKRMDSEMYYIIEINEDGDVSVFENTKEDMLKLINTQEGWDAEIDVEKCNSAIPSDTDPNYWGDKNILIIKGKVVVPEGQTRVTAYEIE